MFAEIVPWSTFDIESIVMVSSSASKSFARTGIIMVVLNDVATISPTATGGVLSATINVLVMIHVASSPGARVMKPSEAQSPEIVVV